MKDEGQIYLILSACGMLEYFQSVIMVEPTVLNSDVKTNLDMQKNEVTQFYCMTSFI